MRRYDNSVVSGVGRQIHSFALHGGVLYRVHRTHCGVIEMRELRFDDDLFDVYTDRCDLRWLFATLRIV